LILNFKNLILLIENVSKNTSLVRMITYENFLENLNIVRENIANACQHSCRNFNSVTILPVTKTHPASIVEYASRAGLTTIAENRVQEAAAKKAQVTSALKWELIGHLQTNKVNLALETFYRIQSVDNQGLLLKLNKAAEARGSIVPILLQVNASKDPAKFGIAPDSVSQHLELALGLKNIMVEGLMTIPFLSNDLTVTQRSFDNLRNIRDKLITEFKVPLPELSMGMSNDYVQAIQAGSTIIRIGRSLFGNRH
jgi:pyridoxal phosphate enzyme (YggS family)